MGLSRLRQPKYYLSKNMAQNASFLARYPEFNPTCQKSALLEAIFSTGLLMSGGYETAPDAVNDSLRNAFIDSYMCLDKGLLRAQNGKPLYRPEHIYVVTNEGTFSAAFHFTYMLWKMGATIVGVPSSQAPNTFMESTPFTLPNTGIQCSVSNAIQRFLPAEDPRAKVFRPDWTPTWEDYRRLGFDSRADLLYILEKISE